MRTPPNERLNPDIAEKEPRGDVSASERRCVLSGESFARDTLIRLAIGPAGADDHCPVMPDIGAKAPGRGAWISPDRCALESAMANGQLKGALARAFTGAKLSIPDNLPVLIEVALTRHLTDRLGLEQRAGNIVLGSSRIAEQARGGAVALLLHASDASEDGRKRLDQAWRVGTESEGSGRRGTVLPLDRDALSVALGRENVVHLGVSGHPGDQRAAQRVGQAVARLTQFVRTGPSQPDQPAAEMAHHAPASGDGIENI